MRDLQVGHSRDGNLSLDLKTGNMFNKQRSLTFAVSKQVDTGEVLVMDYKPGKSDSQAVLDYGVLDKENPQVSNFLR